MKIIEPKEHKNIYILKKVNRVLRNLWNTIKQINIYIVRVSEEEKIEKMVEKTFDEIMSENFSNLKGMDVNIQVKGTLNKIKSKTVVPGYNTIKFSKDRGRILKAAKLIHHIQMIFNKCISKFIMRNFRNQKTIGQYIQKVTLRKYVFSCCLVEFFVTSVKSS